MVPQQGTAVVAFPIAGDWTSLGLSPLCDWFVASTSVVVLRFFSS